MLSIIRKINKSKSLFKRRKNTFKTKKYTKFLKDKIKKLNTANIDLQKSLTINKNHQNLIRTNKHKRLIKNQEKSEIQNDFDENLSILKEYKDTFNETYVAFFKRKNEIIRYHRKKGRNIQWAD